MSDLISRQAVINLLKQMRKDGDMVPWEGMDVFARIRKLPSAQPDHIGDVTEMVGNTISRQDVIDSIVAWTVEDRPDIEMPTDLIGRIKALPSAQPEIIRCKDCKHKPHPSDKYDYDNGDCGFEIIFPDYRCPCRCEDEYYNRIPDDDWFCGNAERRTNG